MDWLIKLVGGYTKDEKSLQDQIIESWRARCIAAETTVALFKEIMARDQERYERLTRPPQGNPNPPEMKPVGQSISSWPRIRRELEKQHRVNENAEVSREKIESQIREEV